MHTEYPLIEILDGEYRSFCLDHGLDDERIANARLTPGLRRWLRDYEARLAAARVLAPLAARALAAEYDTDEYAAAHNAFADAIEPYMTNAERRKWDGYCLKATGEEQIDEAFRILGLPSSRDFIPAKDAPPSVAEYFEQKLSAKLPNPFTGGDTVDKTNEASPAHPDFHIYTGCGIDCKAAIDAAASVLEYLRQDDFQADHEGASAALIGVAALITFVRRSIPSDDLLVAVDNVLSVVRLDTEWSGETLSDVQRITAEIVNCYVYG